MKKLTRISGSLALALIYCFAINLVNIIPSHYASAKLLSGNESYLSVVTESLSSHTANQSYGSENLINFTVSSLYKVDLLKLSSIIKLTQHQIVCCFNQYICFWGNFSIPYKEFKIVFPFHYFW